MEILGRCKGTASRHVGGVVAGSAVALPAVRTPSACPSVCAPHWMKTSTCPSLWRCVRLRASGCTRVCSCGPSTPAGRSHATLSLPAAGTATGMYTVRPVVVRAVRCPSARSACPQGLSGHCGGKPSACQYRTVAPLRFIESWAYRGSPLPLTTERLVLPPAASARASPASQGYRW